MLTPADIKHRTLKTTMGGYNKKDTDEFLASILESFEELSSENAKLKEKLTSLSEGIQYYKNLEDNLQKALVLAEKTSEETKNAAKAEAANIVSLAKKEAEDIVSNARKEASEYTDNAKAEFDKKVTDAQKKYEEINSRLSVLSSSYEEYKQKIKVIIKEQLDFVNGDFASPEAPENLISGDEISGINSFEKEDLVKEEKSNVVEEISAEPDTITEVENDAEIKAASEPDNSVNAAVAKSSDTTIGEKQAFIWQSVDDDDIKDKEIDAENDTVFEIKENEVAENINKSEVLKTEDKKQTDIEEIKLETETESNYENGDTAINNEAELNSVQTEIENEAEIKNNAESKDIQTEVWLNGVQTEINSEAAIKSDEPKNDDDNAEDDIIVENIMMKTPTVNDAIEDVSNTVFPASMPKDDSVSYLSNNNAGSKEKKNPFTFIDLD